MKLIHKTFKRASLFNRVQVLALNILNQCKLERLFIPNVPKDRRHTKKLGALSGAPSALAGNKLIPGTNFPYNKRLNDTAGPDGLSELLKRVFDKPGSRLKRAGIDQVDIDLERSADNAGRWRCCSAC
jgi:hypothetical protein